MTTETYTRQYYTTSEPVGTIEMLLDGEKISAHIFEVDGQHLESGADDFLGIYNPIPYREFDIVDITMPKSCDGWRDIPNPPKYKVYSGFEIKANYDVWYAQNKDVYFGISCAEVDENFKADDEYDTWKTLKIEMKPEIFD